MWQLIVSLMIYLIHINKTIGMDESQLCTIHLKPYEYIRMQSDSKLRLNCDLSLYESKLSQQLDQPIIKYSNKTSPKMSGNVKLRANRTYSCGGIGEGNMKEFIIRDRPGRVKNFQCRSYDFEYWRCTFESTEQIPTRYNLTCMIGGHIYNCNCNKNNSSYECTNEIDRKTHDVYNFVLTSENCFGSRKETFKLRILDNVIPGSLRLSTRNLTSNTATINWEIDTKYMDLYERGFDVKCKYQSEDDSSSWTKLKTIHISKKQSSCLSENLSPYTRYNVRMQVKAHRAVKSFDMWRNASMLLRTSSAIPSGPPDIDQGGFYIDNNQCAHVYWKAVLRHQMGGKGFTYGVNITKDGQPIREMTTPNYYYGKDVVCGQGEYVFSITSRNDLGASNRSSVLRLRISDANDSEDFPRPHRIKSVFNNQTYNLTWSSPKSLRNHGLTNYTVFSCSSRVQSFDFCENAINFTHLPKNRTNITFTNLENKQLIFAVSANYVNGSSGMVPTLCIPHENADLRGLDLKVYTKTNTTLKIEWKLECEQRALITEYNIQYCRADERTELCVEPLKNFTDRHIFPDETQLVLEGLNPFTKYRVQMTLKSAKRRGPLTWVVERTSESAPSAPRNLRACRVFSDGIILQWEFPEYPNGIIEHYNIWINGSISRRADITNTQEKFISYNLTDLSSYSTYIIEVMAVTQELKLTGVRSNQIIIRTRAGEPGEVRVSTAQKENSEVTVSWRAPTDIFGPSDNIYYEVKWSYENKWQSACTNETSYSLKINYEKDRLFQIYVRAINRVSYADDAITSQMCQCSTATASKMYLGAGEQLHYGKWVLVYESSYQSRFALEIFILIGTAILILLLSVAVYLVLKKYQKMKSIKSMMPLGLSDINEESRRPLRPLLITDYSTEAVDTQLSSKFVQAGGNSQLDFTMTTLLENKKKYPLARMRADVSATLQVEHNISLDIKHNAISRKQLRDPSQTTIHFNINSKVNNQPDGESEVAVADRANVINERIQNEILTSKDNREILLPNESQDFRDPNYIQPFLKAIELNALPYADFEKESFIMSNLTDKDESDNRAKSVKRPTETSRNIDQSLAHISIQSPRTEPNQTAKYVKLTDSQKPSTSSDKSKDPKCVQNKQPDKFEAGYVTMDQLAFLMRPKLH